MTDTMTHARIESGNEAPAVWNDEWLPDVDLFPELTELVQEMDRLKAQRQTASANTRRISEAVETHEKQRDDELRAAYAAGEPDKKIPDEREKLKADLEDAQAHANAAVGALLDHINLCIATVVEKRKEWIGFIQEREAIADAEDAALVAQILELRKNRANFSALEYWIERTGGPVRPLSTDPTVAQREKDEIMRESYATHGDVFISDEESRAREAGQQRPGEVNEAELQRASRELRGALAGESGALV